MPNFTMFVGIPGSGKSYQSHILQEKTGAKLYSSDDIRANLELADANRNDNAILFEQINKDIINDLKNGQDVIFDATNLNSKKRMHLLSLIPENTHKECFLVLRIIERCIEANENRDRTIPKEAIIQKAKSFEPPMFYEGWDTITKLYTDNDRGIYGNPEDLINDFIDIPHDSNYHQETIGEHIEMVLNNIDKTDKELYYSALLHDESKPFCKVFHNFKGEPTEQAHYYGHEYVSSYNCFFYNIPEEVDILNVSWLCNNHMKAHDWLKNPNTKSFKRIEKLVDPNLMEKLLELGRADDRGRKFEPQVKNDPQPTSSDLF